MRFSDTFLTSLKTSDRLPDVLRELVPGLKQNGRSDKYVGRVPWRKDEHPSLSVFRGDGGVWFFKDFAQGDGGDAIKLVEKATGRDFPGAVEWLANRLGVMMSESSISPSVAQSPPPVEDQMSGLARLYELAHPLNEDIVAAAYLRQRGLLDIGQALGVRGYEPGEPANLVGRGYELGLWTIEEWTHKGLGFLVFPAIVGDTLCAQRCRLLMSQDKAKRLGLATCHWTPSTKGGLILPATWPTMAVGLPGDAVVLTEGETDCLAIKTLVPQTETYSLLGTSRFGREADEFTRIVKAKSKVTLAFQRDQASAKAAKRITELFARYGIECTAIVPAGGANDWAQLIEWGQKPVTSLGEISAVLGDYSVSRTFDALAKRVADMETGLIQPIPVPWNTVSWAFNDGGIPPETIGLLASKTGVGKSWFVYQLSLFVAGFRQEVDGLPVFVCNTEMAESAVAARLLALAAGDASVVTMRETERIKELQGEHQETLDKLPLEITPPEPRSCEDVIELLKEKAGSRKLLIVDHIGDLSFSGKSWDVLPAFTLKLRDLARRTGTVILLVTHLKAGEAGVDVLAYSKQIENAVDWSLSLQSFDSTLAKVSTACGTDEMTINRTLTIRKNRFGRSQFRIAMDFDEQTLALRDVGRLIKLCSKAP